MSPCGAAQPRTSRVVDVKLRCPVLTSERRISAETIFDDDATGCRVLKPTPVSKACRSAPESLAEEI